MNYSLNFFTTIKDENFKKIAFYDKKSIFYALILSFISVTIFVSFPLITQFFISNIYNKNDINYLIFFTIFFLMLFLLKLAIDVVVEKYKIKYFIKIEKNIKEMIINSYGDDTKTLLGRRSMLYKKDVHLYILLIRTIYESFQDTTKILVISIIIFFYDQKLFLYFSFTIPILLLIYFIGRRFSRLETAKNTSYYESDFALMVKKSMDSNFDEKRRKKFYMRCIEETMKERTSNKTKSVSFNVLMRSYINFFRLIYLAYFGYYIILYDLKLDGLIVGLLYITILIRPITNILIYLNNYEICTKSFFRVNSLLNNS